MAIVKRNPVESDSKYGNNSDKSALTADKLTDEKKSGAYDIRAHLRDLGLCWDD